ncbi:24608_t:CDS:2 [Cetraspora pellucida]|uniref:24608_t:CDS:1 n=1 Tax=Cetraspora pellucida TaxID=1433469 RepID=A0A9N9C1U0_9GLOM|nr:24608_t:CDS:2 [Cetraspora pellucida]
MKAVGNKNKLEEVLLKRANNLAERGNSMSSESKYSKSIFGLIRNSKYDGTNAEIIRDNYEKIQKKGSC